MANTFAVPTAQPNAGSGAVASNPVGSNPTDEAGLVKLVTGATGTAAGVIIQITQGANYSSGVDATNGSTRWNVWGMDDASANLQPRVNAVNSRQLLISVANAPAASTTYNFGYSAVV